MRSKGSKTDTSGSNGREMVQRMRQKLKEDASSTKSDGWEELWKEGVTPWDLSKPTPALGPELQHNLNECHNKEGTFKILIPGCGSGFDILTIMEHQEHVRAQGLIQDSLIVGLDISSTSLEKANIFLQKELSSKQFYDDNTNSGTSIVLAKGDFFDCTTWTTEFTFQTGGHELPSTKNAFQEASFDFIYDYVFFCALPPEMRDSWGNAISSLLKPRTGRLLTLMFPVVRNVDRNKGPPYAIVPEDYQSVLERREIVMELEPYESPHTIPERVGKELVCWWRRCDGKEQDSARRSAL